MGMQTKTGSSNPSIRSLSVEDESTIRTWLESLGESPSAIAQDLQTARAHPDTAAWLLARARSA
jgi:hypothetical protein